MYAIDLIASWKDWRLVQALDPTRGGILNRTTMNCKYFLLKFYKLLTFR